MISVYTDDVASFEQIVQSANAVPTIAIGLKGQSVFTPDRWQLTTVCPSLLGTDLPHTVLLVESCAFER